MGPENRPVGGAVGGAEAPEASVAPVATEQEKDTQKKARGTDTDKDTTQGGDKGDNTGETERSTSTEPDRSKQTPPRDRNSSMNTNNDR